jgi:NAD(P)H dehydrogenase (quinone)
VHDFIERGLLGHRAWGRSHDFPDLAAMLLHEVRRGFAGADQKLQPAAWFSLRPDLRTPEAHLATCDMGFTILRPSSFVDILARAGTPVANDTWGGAAGEGLVNLIDTRDVASFFHNRPASAFVT